jgi:hypothetical protein
VGNDQWRSLAELNAEAPDHHYGSTVDNLAALFDASEDLRCFRVEHVLVAEINESQLYDDPEDIEGYAKIESIRSTIRLGIPLPAVVLVHAAEGRSRWVLPASEGDGFYDLLEGRHRYNAVYRERVPRIHAWVAHVGCCGGPGADLEGEALGDQHG